MVVMSCVSYKMFLTES